MRDMVLWARMNTAANLFLYALSAHTKLDLTAYECEIQVNSIHKFSSNKLTSCLKAGIYGDYCPKKLF